MQGSSSFAFYTDVFRQENKNTVIAGMALRQEVPGSLENTDS